MMSEPRIAMPHDRRFTILDSMVLLAALTPALTLRLGDLLDIQYVAVTNPSGFTVVMLQRMVLIGASQLFYPTLALVALRFRHPRPQLGQLIQRPGFVSCGVVLLVGAVPGIHTFAKLTVIGGVIAGSWLILAVNQWWSPEASWVDRTGRVFGACWVGLALLSCLILYLRT
jgi:hypothetical protein